MTFETDPSLANGNLSEPVRLSLESDAVWLTSLLGSEVSSTDVRTLQGAMDQLARVEAKNDRPSWEMRFSALYDLGVSGDNKNGQKDPLLARHYSVIAPPPDPRDVVGRMRHITELGVDARQLVDIRPLFVLVEPDKFEADLVTARERSTQNESELIDEIAADTELLSPPPDGAKTEGADSLRDEEEETRAARFARYDQERALGTLAVPTVTTKAPHRVREPVQKRPSPEKEAILSHPHNADAVRLAHSLGVNPARLIRERYGVMYFPTKAKIESTLEVLSQFGIGTNCLTETVHRSVQDLPAHLSELKLITDDLGITLGQLLGPQANRINPAPEVLKHKINMWMSGLVAQGMTRERVVDLIASGSISLLSSEPKIEFDLVTLALCARNGHLRESDMRTLTIQVSASVLLDSIRDFINLYEHGDEIGRAYGLQELIRITNHKYTHSGGTDSIEDEISQHPERYTSDPRLKTLYDLYLKVMQNKNRSKEIATVGRTEE